MEVKRIAWDEGLGFPSNSYGHRVILVGLTFYSMISFVTLVSLKLNSPQFSIVVNYICKLSEWFAYGLVLEILFT